MAKISLNLDDELLAEIAKHAEKNNQNQSDAIRDLLAAALAQGGTADAGSEGDGQIAATALGVTLATVLPIFETVELLRGISAKSPDLIATARTRAREEVKRRFELSDDELSEME